MDQSMNDGALARDTQREGRMRALELLLSRQSAGALQEPAPEGAELDLILDAGLRAPDHGRLRPWRFVLIRGAQRAKWAERLGEGGVARGPRAGGGPWASALAPGFSARR